MRTPTPALDRASAAHPLMRLALWLGAGLALDYSDAALTRQSR